jgi:6-phosphofructokinase 1
VVVSRGAEIATVPMADTAGKVNTVPVDHEMIRTARGLGIGFGDEEDIDLAPEPLD